MNLIYDNITVDVDENDLAINYAAYCELNIEHVVEFPDAISINTTQEEKLEHDGRLAFEKVVYDITYKPIVDQLEHIADMLKQEESRVTFDKKRPHPSWPGPSGKGELRNTIAAHMAGDFSPPKINIPREPIPAPEPPVDISAAIEQLKNLIKEIKR